MTKTTSAKETHTRERLGTPTDLKPEAARDISAALAGLLADVFALYVKTKNFHWHMSGPHFRDYHLLLDEQSEQIFAMTDPIAERARKIGGATLRSIGDIARRQRILDNDADYVDPQDMLAELRDDNKSLTARHAPGPQCLRRLRRRRDREPPRNLDRRDRATHLVPVRGDAQRGGERLTGDGAEPSRATAETALLKSVRSTGDRADPSLRPPGPSPGQSPGEAIQQT